MRSAVLLAVLGVLVGAAAQPPVAGGHDAPSAERTSTAVTPVWITLGTGGGPLLRTRRGGPANALVMGNDVTLFDVGEGTIRGLAAAGLRFDQVHTIVISHLHPDHIAELAALIALRWQVAATSPLAIVGPRGTRELVAGIIAAMKPVEGTALPGEQPIASSTRWVTTRVLDCAGETFPLGAARLTAVRNSHFKRRDGTNSTIAISCSYRIEGGGRTIVYTGDTGPSDAVTALARNADLLVSEVIDLDAALASVRRQAPNLSPAQLAGVKWHLQSHHLTPVAVAALAREADVKAVVLTHLVPGTDDEDIVAYTRGMADIYRGKVIVARDGDRF